jgi:hypothetical protein
MLWVYIVVSSIWFGYEVIRFLAPKIWDELDILSGGAPVGFALVTWLFLLIRYFHPLTVLIGVVVSISLFLLSYFLHLHNPRPLKFRALPGSFLCILAFFTVLCYVLVDLSFLKNGRDSSGTVFSDLPFHLSLISTFAYGGNSFASTLTTPFYFGANLSYPIIPDVFSAFLVRCGKASLRISVTVPTMILLWSIIFCFHSLAVQFTSRPFVPELSIFLFFFAAGVGWKWFFRTECRNEVNSNMAHCFCPGKETFWIHSVVHYLLPQRSGLFSLSISIMLSSLLVTVVENEQTSGKSMFLAGLMMGLLPMLSAHSFIAAGEFAIFTAVLNFPWKPINFSRWIEYVVFWCKFGVTAILIALPQVLWLLRTPRNKFFSIKPIWLETNTGYLGFFVMWWESLGPLPFFALGHVWIFLTARQIRMYLPALGVFVVSTVFRYQAGAMDNTKVFLATWFPLAVVAVSDYLLTLFRYSRKNILVLSISSFLLVSMTFSSAVCYYKAIRHTFSMYTKEEMELGLWVMENTRSDVQILSVGWHAAPMMSIGGRPISLGFGGWVWTHGLDYDSRHRWLRGLVKQKEEVDVFAKQKLMYAVSKEEDGGGRIFPNPGANSHWICVVDEGSFQLYRLLER